MRINNIKEKNIKIDIVSHSMGFAYSLGIIDVLTHKDNDYKIGMVYAIAPENPKAGERPKLVDGFFKYGSTGEEGLYRHDLIAHQDTILGVDKNEVVPIPDYVIDKCYVVPKNILPSGPGNNLYNTIPEKNTEEKNALRECGSELHLIKNYNWIFELNEKQNGYIRPKK